MSDTPKVIDANTAFADLMKTQCKGCGGVKASRKSHCRSCYFRLSRDLQRRLYRRIGQGYEEAYTESLAALQGMVGQ